MTKEILEFPYENKRAHQRVEVSFPAKAVFKSNKENKLKHINCTIVDLSKNGIGLIADSLLPDSSVVIINVDSSPRYSLFQIEASIVWSKPVFKNGYFRCGLHFLRIEDPHRSILTKVLIDYKLLDRDFASLTREIGQFLEELKYRLDEYDKINNDESRQISFIKENKKDIFEKLDNYFEQAWDIVKNFGRDKYAVNQNYYQQVLGYLLLELIETNRHVYRKPSGYPGDYIMMNYIYDYHNDNYLGRSSYQKLINHYTCNIPISCSNIRRKDFLKLKLTETLKRKDNPKVLSLASGSARELIELLREGGISSPMIFKCLDFGKKALDYVKNEISKIEITKRQTLSIEYVCRDIVSIIRDNNLKEELRDCDFIYAFGIFDYLSDRMASRLTKELFGLLQREGELIIFNASLENNIYRAYYELLGEWNIVHRTEQDMLSWTQGLGNLASVKFEKLRGGNNYLCLSIIKQ